MTPTPVRLWVDPGCPWAWQGAVWLRRLADAGVVELDWRIFSLELNSSELDAPFWEACPRYGESLVALALARREGGGEAFDAFYRELGRSLQEEKREVSPEVVRAAAAAAGHVRPRRSSGRHAGADRGDPPRVPGRSTGKRLRRADPRDRRISKVVYGPVFAIAPEGEEAKLLWEHTLWMAERPDFFEMKRWPRDIRPGEPLPGPLPRR